MRTVIAIPDGLWEKAKQKALKERVSLAEIVRRALREYLAREKSKKKGGKQQASSQGKGKGGEDDDPMR